MKFSVIIPVYNVEKYIDDCVKSVLNQTYNDFEILLVDDGSTDCSPAICDEYAKKYNNIKVYHKKNGGLSDARNYGISACSGEYIIFLDSDDTIDNKYLDRISCEIENEKWLDIICIDALVLPHKEKKQRNFKLANRTMTGVEFLKNAVPCQSLFTEACFSVFRREFLLENKLYFKFGILHEDIPFTPIAMFKAKKVRYVPEMFYNYYMHQGSIMNLKDFSKNIGDTYNSCCEVLHFFENEDKEVLKQIEEWLVVRYLGLYRRGKCYRYGKKYIHKKFVFKYAHSLKSRIKSVIFCISPRFYCYL